MPNVLLTEKCVRSCPYCFAKKHMEESDNTMMRWDNLIYVLDFFHANKQNSISYLGGEPTIHPDFINIIEYTLKRRFKVCVFTSGVIPKIIVDKLYRTIEKNKDFESIHFICNINKPKNTSEREWKLIEQFFIKFSNSIVQGFNIFEESFDLTFLFHNIAKYGLANHLRIGLAHHIYNANNKCITPVKYEFIVTRLASFLPYFNSNKVTLGLDCGFPLCVFPDEILGKFYKAKASFQWNCSPVIDIGPDLTIWPCFPLCHLKEKSLLEFNNFNEINEYFIKLVGEKRKGNKGAFLECDICHYQENGLCSGGCLSYSLPV